MAARWQRAARAALRVNSQAACRIGRRNAANISHLAAEWTCLSAITKFPRCERLVIMKFPHWTVT